MSYSQTTNLELYKENADEPIKNLRTHNNSNMDTLDTQIQALKDVITNAKALLGQLGVDANGDPVIDASTARGTLGAAWDNSSGTNLYAVNQAVSDNATAIASLQDSVSPIDVTSNVTPKNWSTAPTFTATKYGHKLTIMFFGGTVSSTAASTVVFQIHSSLAPSDKNARVLFFPVFKANESNPFVGLFRADKDLTNIIINNNVGLISGSLLSGIMEWYI